MTIREQILKGHLEYPGTKLLEKYPNKDIKGLWNSLWYSFINRESINSLYWYSKLGAKVLNEVIVKLDAHKWVVSNSLSARRWADLKLNEDKILEFISSDELQTVREKYKYAKYILECKPAKKSNLVKQNNQIKQTGIVREGFKNAGNTQFGYDMDTLKEYEEAVKANLTKSMDKIKEFYPTMVSETDSYDVVSAGIFDWHYENPMEVFTIGENVSDSRGRAIYDCLSKVANPISSKDFRAALIIPQE